MVNLRNKRSARQLVSLPFPTSSSTLLCDGDPSPEQPRFSAESLAPPGAYSPLFTSGLGVMRAPTPSPTLSSFPSPPKHDLSITLPNGSPTSLSSEKPSVSPAKSSSPLKTPHRRRRSSVIETTPQRLAKSGLDSNVERALDSVMRSLRQVAMSTPRARDSYREQSRWSSSSEESMPGPGESEDGGFWRPRKSFESNRSRATSRSRKSRKSEDTETVEIEAPVPPVPKVQVPVTPGRRQRMMEGLVKRLGLTPRKKSMPPPMSLEDRSMPPPLPVEAPMPPEIENPSWTLPPAPPERTLPKKSSLRSLRSVLSKKSSTTTLRSMRSAALSHHPFANTGPIMDCDPPPVPRRPIEEVPFCLPTPTTPRGRRTPKTSIGQPRLQPSTSPSKFLQDMPRRAPGTPKDDEGLDDLPVPVPAIPKPLSPAEEIRFDAESYSSPVIDSFTSPRTQSIPGDASSYSSPGVGSFTSPRAHSTPSDLSTPRSEFIMTPNASMEVDTPSTGTPVLTARAADSALKPKRLLSLLPRQQRANLGLQSPMADGKRTKKSTVDMRAFVGMPLKEKNTNILSRPTPFPSTNKTPSDVIRDTLKNEPFKVPAEARRDPLGLLGKRVGSDEMPYRGGAGDGWATPFPRLSEHGQDDYFVFSKSGREPDDHFDSRFASEQETHLGNSEFASERFGNLKSASEEEQDNHSGISQPASEIENHSSVSETIMEQERGTKFRPSTFGTPSPLDFTASPKKRFSTSTTRSARRRKESDVSMETEESAARTEEWELEGWLREVERVEARV
ncbi:hypothetical protein BCR39DRAFT_589709 [Naematelia encephala]|uniref:Uncharacterized protein n=1 Tax=Naematelia encephala TaxID=71784 RepID=A0A1Y2AV45_9TREE|nr:hypothetical protein BCR39DRAFT_589709 [Naematelia encephala]